MTESDRPLLLRSKLTIPLLRAPLVRRPALTAQLDEGVQRALVLVSAPAGFGKSTALAQWAAASALPVAWLSLDAGDNEPARFFSYLRRALAGTDGRDDLPAVAEETEALPAQTLAAHFLAEVEQRTAPVAVVLDDYQVIVAAPIHEAVAFLLEHRPPWLHLIIATRADPPLPLARLRAQRELVEVRAQTLRFTVAEVARFLNQGMGLTLNEAQLSALAERTEGWIAGVQLAALSLREEDDPDAFIEALSGSHRFILDYLIEEVVDRQPAAVREFLLATALLERLTASLCEAVSGREGGQAMLERLEAANLFLVPLDNERRWYRYHHLFGELLRTRLQQSETETGIASLHRRAAAWYDAHGWPVEAIEHTLAAGEPARAADLIERHGHAQWGLSNTNFLQLIGRLPPEMLLRRPLLGMYQAWTLIVYGQIAAAQGLLRALATRLDEVEATPEMAGVRAFVALLLAYTPAMLGEPLPERLPAPGALAQVPDSRLAMRNSADVVYAYLLYLRGDLEAAAAHLQIPLERDVAAQGTTAIPLAASRLAQIRQIQGRLREAEALCRRYRSYVAERGRERFYVAGNLDLVLGDLLRERNDLEAAADHVAGGLATDKPWRVPHAQALGGLALARVQQAQGKVDSALATITAIERQIADRVILPALRSEIQAFKVRLWLESGRLDEATQWASTFLPLPALSFSRELEFLALARVWLAGDQTEPAAALLARLAKAARAGGRQGRLLQIELLQALLLEAAGRRSAARQQAGNCVRQAAAEGYVRLFVDEGEAMRALLTALAPTAPAEQAEYIRHLLGNFPEAEEGVASPTPGLVEPLTPREQEVLQLICAGHSNRTIAAEMTVTVATVKKHASNIYGKLGVDSRAQAMVRARELRLVPPVDPAP